MNCSKTEKHFLNIRKNKQKTYSAPASRLEEERRENMTYEENLKEDYEFFKHRKEMRAKEGVIKWPFWVEEPVDDEDWKHYEQHVQDRLAGKENPAKWPPTYWDDPTE